MFLFILRYQQSKSEVTILDLVFQPNKISKNRKALKRI